MSKLTFATLATPKHSIYSLKAIPVCRVEVWET